MANMNLSFLEDYKIPPGPKYQVASIEYIGAQGYTLSSFEAYVRFHCQNGGFRVDFREPLHVPAEVLLGPKVSWGWLTDIRIVSGGHAWSLATLFPTDFPKKIRAGEVFSVNAK
jgi:hypothetical protein